MNIEEKLKQLLGNDLGEKLIKIANQLEKIDVLENEIEKIKERLNEKKVTKFGETTTIQTKDGLTSSVKLNSDCFKCDEDGTIKSVPNIYTSQFATITEAKSNNTNDMYIEFYKELISKYEELTRKLIDTLKNKKD